MFTPTGLYHVLYIRFKLFIFILLRNGHAIQITQETNVLFTLLKRNRSFQIFQTMKLQFRDLLFIQCRKVTRQLCVNKVQRQRFG